MLRNLFYKKKEKEKPVEYKFVSNPIVNQAKNTADISASYLEVKDLISVSTVCLSSRDLYKQALKEALIIKKLLRAVVYGDYATAEKMIIDNPKLLLKRETIKDCSGRIHPEKTALQLAFGAVDATVIASSHRKGGTHLLADGMIEMIKKNFNRLPNKTPEEIKTIIHDQYMGQFPEGYQKIMEVKNQHELKGLHHITQILSDAKNTEVEAVSKIENKIHQIIRKEKSEQATALRKLVQSVMKASSNENFEEMFKELKDYIVKNHFLKTHHFNFELFRALYWFRNTLEPKTPQKFGEHFNYSLLIETMRIYGNVSNYVEHKTPKSLFYWQKVFGYVLRFVPAQVSQILKASLFFKWNYTGKCSRNLTFLGSDNYNPLDLNPNKELGYRTGGFNRCEAGTDLITGSRACREGYERGIAEEICIIKMTKK